MLRGSNGRPLRLRRPGGLVLLFCIGLQSAAAAAEGSIVHDAGAGGETAAQTAADRLLAGEALSPETLISLVAPVALYPDDLLAVVLSAATRPAQVNQAARYLQARQADPGLAAENTWDPSVVALLNYPEVLQRMSTDMRWTRTLGQAVLLHQPQLISAVASFRRQAYAAGTLKSDHRLTIVATDHSVEIRPAYPQVLYVPYYDPALVTSPQTIPAYHFYPRPYPVYYYPYTSYYPFTSRWFWGVRNHYRIGWLDRLVYSSRPYADSLYEAESGRADEHGLRSVGEYVHDQSRAAESVYYQAERFRQQIDIAANPRHPARPLAINPRHPGRDLAINPRHPGRDNTTVLRSPQRAPDPRGGP